MSAARVSLGVVLLVRPEAIVRLGRAEPSSRLLGVIRVLGLRYLAQGILDAAVPHEHRIDAAVELLHAASMLPLVRPGAPHARLALLSAGVASALACADLADGPPRLTNAAGTEDRSTNSGS